ncbi:hypothetical protein GCM10027188_28890 [Lysobacter humi (ex Lee et al. 2017)]
MNHLERYPKWRVLRAWFFLVGSVALVLRTGIYLGAKVYYDVPWESSDAIIAFMGVGGAWVAYVCVRVLRSRRKAVAGA